MSIPTIERLMLFIKPVDYAEWVTYSTVTMGEFGLLLSNCNPDMGEEKLYFLLKELEAMNGVIVDEGYLTWPKYHKLRSVLRKLDRAKVELTKEDEALYSDGQDSIYSDKKWRMEFLVYFAKIQGFDVPDEMAELDKNFKPERKKDISKPSKLEINDELLNKIKSSNIYTPLLWIFEKYYKHKKSFQMAKTIEQEIKDKYNIEANKDSDEIYLSANSCEFLNDFMRIILDLKRS